MADVERYSTLARMFHWLTFALIVAAAGFGISLEQAPKGWGDTLYRLHWSFGATILGLSLLRLGYRAVHGAPAPYEGLTRIERIVSAAVHHGIYLMLLVAPVLGWVGKSAYGGDISIFGLFNLPALVPQSDDLAKIMLGAHKVAVKLLIVLIILHVAGALNHALIKKDGVLARMWPGR